MHDLNDAGIVSGQLSDLISRIDYSQLVGVATGLLSRLTDAASTLVLLLTALIFVAIESAGSAGGSRWSARSGRTCRSRWDFQCITRPCAWLSSQANRLWPSASLRSRHARVSKCVWLSGIRSHSS